MSYENKAKTILKNAIKSAIYVDDQAKAFYQNENLTGAQEEQLSVELYNNFRENGISLEVYKYHTNDEKDPNKMSFLLENRDLVILDWNLKGKVGEEESLNILNQITQKPYINFCAIYTVEPNLDDVLKNIVSYFSGLTKEEFNQIKEYSDSLFEDKSIYDDFHFVNLNRNNSDAGPKIGNIMQKAKSDINKLKELTGINDNKCIIIKTSIVNLLNAPFLPEEITECPTYVDNKTYTVVIKDTIITIFKKSENNPENLLNNFKNHIINKVEGSFNQLLGIELYNHLFRTSAITNDSIMSFAKDALIHHRRRLKDDGIGHFFKSFMDEILLEKIALSLRNRESELLDDQLLDEFESLLPSEYKDLDALHKMNVFYNSFYLDKKGHLLNFGDVFIVKHDDERHNVAPKYLICITALCDCLKPQDKIKSNFYFAEGTNISKKDAIELGDTAFVSFLPNNITIKWTEVAQNELRKNFSPIYIKPLQYKVFEGENTIDENNEIKIHYLDKKGELKTELLTYLGTVRPNYTQRIANHAFAYPIRVGVDFVKM